MRWALCCPLFVGLVLPKRFDLAWLVADTEYHPCRSAIFFLFPSPSVPDTLERAVTLRTATRWSSAPRPADGDNAPAQKGGRRSLAQALG